MRLRKGGQAWALPLVQEHKRADLQDPSSRSLRSGPLVARTEEELNHLEPLHVVFEKHLDTCHAEGINNCPYVPKHLPSLPFLLPSLKTGRTQESEMIWWGRRKGQAMPLPVVQSEPGWGSVQLDKSLKLQIRPDFLLISDNAFEEWERKSQQNIGNHVCMPLNSHILDKQHCVQTALYTCITVSSGTKLWREILRQKACDAHCQIALQMVIQINTLRAL